MKVDRILEAGILAMLLAFVGTLYLSLHDNVVQAGDRAPDFSIQADNGKTITARDFGGKLLILNFWATWCPPCVDEAPSLNALQHRIAPLGGTVLGVSIDDDEQAYEKFITNFRLDFPTYRDTTKQIPLIYGTTMYPDTYIIDRKGKLDRKIVGPQDWSSTEMTLYLDKLLNAK